MTRHSGNNKGYDAVVIGAGLNGLVTAGYLARGGLAVLVLEQRDNVGGSAVTEEFAPGFRCDTCVHDVGWISPRMVRDLDLPRYGLVLQSHGDAVLAPDGHGGFLRLHSTTAGTVESLRKFSTTDAAKWPAFAARIAGLASFLETVYAAPAPNIHASSTGELLGLLNAGLRLRRLGKAAMVDLLRTVPMSVAELLDDAFDSDVLKGVLGSEGVRHLCQGPRSGGTAFMLLHHQVGRQPGAFHSTLTPRGGVGQLSTALADSARASGVEIRTGMRVDRIIVRDEGASAVVLASGEEIAAPRVISSADPRSTFLNLCEPSQLAPEFVNAVRNVRFRGVWAKVNLALDSLPDFGPLARGDEGQFGTICISPSLTYLERAYDAAKYGRTSQRPYLDVRIPSVAKPGFAPPGKHVMSVHVQYVPYQLRDGSWDNAARDALGDQVVATLAEYAPGLPGLVRHRQVLTPLDLETRFALPEGHAYHGEMTLDQILFMRPVPECSEYRTPVRGLFLCGAGTHPGGGVAGGAGANAARIILKNGARTARSSMG
ncbi:MAG TPA: NAD(P)/FAD-dependent oxidoreductase [Gemmatimonadaceae bacterium]|nr:NAD(P)/FAD-dependent oxidoreductase [Gemmatimonadaceae bacterium]